jgi:hypothetical protein
VRTSTCSRAASRSARATALGALIGGTGALTAARWKNRATPQGTTSVQLGDEMLHALAADALLRYAALTRVLPPAAHDEALRLLDAEREPLAELWARARREEPDAALPAELTDRVQALLAQLLTHLDGTGVILAAARNT